MPHDDAIKGAEVSARRPNCSKPRQANPRIGGKFPGLMGRLCSRPGLRSRLTTRIGDRRTVTSARENIPPKPAFYQHLALAGSPTLQGTVANGPRGRARDNPGHDGMGRRDLGESSARGLQGPSKKIFGFRLVLFVRIETFQWVAAIPNKKFSPPLPSPPSASQNARADDLAQDSSVSGFNEGFVSLSQTTRRA